MCILKNLNIHQLDYMTEVFWMWKSQQCLPSPFSSVTTILLAPVYSAEVIVKYNFRNKYISIGRILFGLSHLYLLDFIYLAFCLNIGLNRVF